MIGIEGRMRWSNVRWHLCLTAPSSVFTMGASFAGSRMCAPPWRPSGAWSPCCWTGATNLKRLADSYVRRLDPARDEGEFDISIPDEEVRSVRNVRDMCAGVERLVAAKNADAPAGQ